MSRPASRGEESARGRGHQLDSLVGGSLQRQRPLVGILPSRLNNRGPAIDFARQGALGSFRGGFILRHWLGVDLVESPYKVGIQCDELHATEAALAARKQIPAIGAH